jgi:two-component system chemotaxis response regulator CheY
MGRTVVVADDSKFLISQIVNFFEKEMGYTVVGTAVDGNQAVELFKKYKPDLVTLDITMPNKDGQEAMKEIFAEDAGANILMISAVRGDAMLECMSMGAKGYIEKPLKFSNPEFVQDFKETVNEIFSNT